MTKTIKKPRADQKTGGVSYPYPELGEEEGERILWPVVFSLVGHVAVLAALIFVPQPSFEKSYMPTVISVEMVSLGDMGSGPPAADVSVKEKPAPEPELAPEPEPEPASEPEPEPAKVEEVQSQPEVAVEPPRKVPTVEKKPVPPPVQEPEPEVSLAPKEKEPEKPVEKPAVKEKPKVKESLKEKTYKPSQIVKNAIERLEKETVEQPRANSVLDAIEKLRKDVETNPRKQPASSEKVASASGAGTGGTGTGATGTGTGAGRPGFGGGGPGGVLGGMFDVYKAEIAYHIQRNWAFSEQLAQGRKDLEVLVGIKIMPDGRIEDVWFDKKSGNQYLDDSAIRAVKKSSPLPPLPKTYRGSFLETGLRFTPAGLGGGR